MGRAKRRRAHNLGCVYQRGPRNSWIKWRECGRQVRRRVLLPRDERSPSGLDDGAQERSDLATRVVLAP